MPIDTCNRPASSHLPAYIVQFGSIHPFIYTVPYSIGRIAISVVQYASNASPGQFSMLQFSALVEKWRDDLGTLKLLPGKGTYIDAMCAEHPPCLALIIDKAIEQEILGRWNSEPRSTFL
jgi:hypothetical protein